MIGSYHRLEKKERETQEKEKKKKKKRRQNTNLKEKVTSMYVCLSFFQREREGDKDHVYNLAST